MISNFIAVFRMWTFLPLMTSEGSKLKWRLRVFLYSVLKCYTQERQVVVEEKIVSLYKEEEEKGSNMNTHLALKLRTCRYMLGTCQDMSSAHPFLPTSLCLLLPGVCMFSVQVPCKYLEKLLSNYCFFIKKKWIFFFLQKE